MAGPDAPDFAVDKQRINQDWESPLYAPNIETLRGLTSLGDFFEQANAMAAKMCVDDSAFIPERLDKEKVQHVLENVDYSGIDTLSDEYWDFLGVAMTKSYISRKIVREVVEGRNALNISQTEKVVLLGSLDIGDHTDRLFWEYRENVVTSPLAQRLHAMGAENAIKFLQEQKALPEKPDEFLYTVFKETEPGKIVAETYAEAFPEAIGGMTRAMNEIVEKLEALHDTEDEREKDALIHYFRKLREATASTNQTDHARLHEEVDLLWGEVHGRMQPVHMMEGYEDSLGLRVDPEYSLRFIDDRYKDVNDLAAVAKQYVIDYMKSEFADFSSMHASLHALESSVVGIFTGVADSGRANVFKSAGQNVPNRENVKVANGVKIFVDIGTMFERFKTEKAYLVKLFGKEVAERVFAGEDRIVRFASGFFVGGHEDGHNVFVQVGTRSGLGASTYKEVEENKADQAIVAAIPERLSEEELRLFLLGFIPSAIRDLTLGTDKAKHPYYNGGLQTLNVMYEVGMLTIGEDGFLNEPDLSAGTMAKFFQRSREVFRELALAYEYKSHEEAEEYIQEYYQVTPFIRYMLSKMDLGPSPHVSISRI